MCSESERGFIQPRVSVPKGTYRGTPAPQEGSAAEVGEGRGEVGTSGDDPGIRGSGARELVLVYLRGKTSIKLHYIILTHSDSEIHLCDTTLKTGCLL